MAGEDHFGESPDSIKRLATTGSFIIVTDYLMEETVQGRVHWNTTNLYMVICHACGKRRCTTMPRELMQKQLGISNRAFISARDSLVRMELLTVQRRGQGMSSIYTIEKYVTRSMNKEITREDNQ